MNFFTEKKFRLIRKERKHHLAAEMLKKLWKKYNDQEWKQYQIISSWLNLDKIPFEIAAISERYHLHLENAGTTVNEQSLLPQTIQGDRQSKIPFLPISIYLDNLRSAFNVGSIIRTTEAFRLGEIIFSTKTPDNTNRKVQEVSMGSFAYVSCKRSDLSRLQGPLIALETTVEAQSIFTYSFPRSFTLMLGNEEFGLSHEALSQADACISIPMPGFKNSLNVASAFAVAAAQIHLQQRELHG